MTDLQELEAIKRLKYKYLRCLDQKRWEDLATCFTADAQCSYGDGKYSFDGRDAILKFLESVMPRTMLTSHRVHHPEIDFVQRADQGRELLAQTRGPRPERMLHAQRLAGQVAGDDIRPATVHPLGEDDRGRHRKPRRYPGHERHADTELDTTPRRVRMAWAARMDKPAFIGKAALERTAKERDERLLHGFTMDGDAPLEGSPIYVEDRIVGHVSGSWASPSLGKTVMLGWIKHLPYPDRVTIDGREALVTPTPFYDPEGERARA